MVDKQIRLCGMKCTVAGLTSGNIRQGFAQELQPIILDGVQIQMSGSLVEKLFMEWLETIRFFPAESVSILTESKNPR